MVELKDLQYLLSRTSTLLASSLLSAGETKNPFNTLLGAQYE